MISQKKIKISAMKKKKHQAIERRSSIMKISKSKPPLPSKWIWRKAKRQSRRNFAPLLSSPLLKIEPKT